MDLQIAPDHKEDSPEDSVTGNWIVTSTRRLIDYQPIRHSGLPLAFCMRSYKNLDCIVTDMFSQEITITNISDLGSIISQEMNITDISRLFYTTLKYSKEGWMLFRVRECFLLLNIFTGKRLRLPDNSSPNLGRHCAFSTSSSSVDYVVHVNREERNGWTTIYIARPQDEAWEMYAQQNRHSMYCFDYTAVIIVGKKVYCFDDGEMIDVFDLVERHWVHVTVSQDAAKKYYKFHVMEVDGIGIVKMYPPSVEFNRYEFYRLEENEFEQLATWVEMSEEEMEYKSWFVDRTRTFCVNSLVREAALYRFTTGVDAESGLDFGMNLQVHDLKTAWSDLLQYPDSMKSKLKMMNACFHYHSRQALIKDGHRPSAPPSLKPITSFRRKSSSQAQKGCRSPPQNRRACIFDHRMSSCRLSNRMGSCL